MEPVGEAEAPFVHERRARPDRLPPPLDGGEGVPARAALAAVVAPVEEVEEVQPPAEKARRDVADPGVVAVGRPVLDAPRDRTRVGHAAAGVRPGRDGHAHRRHARRERPRRVEVGLERRHGKHVVVDVAVHRNREMRPRHADFDVVDAVRLRQEPERNPDAQPRERRLDDGARAVRHREREVVPGVAVVALEPGRPSRHPQREAQRPRLDERLVRRDVPQVDPHPHRESCPDEERPRQRGEDSFHLAAFLPVWRLRGRSPRTECDRAKEAT